MSTAQAQFSVDYISASVFLNTFDPLLAVDASSSYKPAFTYDKQEYSSPAGTVAIKSMKLDKPGTIYFILVFNKRIAYNKITGHSDIEIRPAVVPSG